MSQHETDEKIRIHHECEGGIPKFVSEIVIWHHEAFQVMTNVDPEVSFSILFSRH